MRNDGTAAGHQSVKRKISRKIVFVTTQHAKHDQVYAYQHASSHCNCIELTFYCIGSKYIIMPINIEAGIIDFDDPLEDLPAHVKTDLKRIALIAFACILAIEFLVVFILMFAFPAPRPKRKDGETVKTLVVLGSGKSGCNIIYAS